MAAITSPSKSATSRRRSSFTRMFSTWRNSTRGRATPSSRLRSISSSQCSERKGMTPDSSDRHFGVMVRDEAQLASVRDKLTWKYRLELIAGFRCDFRDPWGNRVQVVDLHDESLIWLLPYREVQKAG